jgi:hypothetical protein
MELPVADTRIYASVMIRHWQQSNMQIATEVGDTKTNPPQELHSSWGPHQAPNSEAEERLSPLSVSSPVFVSLSVDLTVFLKRSFRWPATLVIGGLEGTNERKKCQCAGIKH